MNTQYGGDEAEAIWQRVYAASRKLGRARRELTMLKRRAKASATTMHAAAGLLEVEGEGANDPQVDALVRKLRRQAAELLSAGITKKR